MKLQEYLWILPFLSFLCGYFLFGLFFHTSYIETPSIIGTNLSEAALLASQKNLNLRIIDQKEDTDLADGTIISQTPAPFQHIRPHQALFCAISRKPKKPITSYFIQKNIGQIQEIIDLEKIRVKKFYVPNSYPKDVCFAQLPAPGKPLEHTAIAYISQGPLFLYLFPSFKNQSLMPVKEFLEHQGIAFHIFHRKPIENNHQCSSCIIIDQRPLPGSLIDLSKSLIVQLQVQ